MARIKYETEEDVLYALLNNSFSHLAVSTTHGKVLLPKNVVKYLLHSKIIKPDISLAGEEPWIELQVHKHAKTTAMASAHELAKMLGEELSQRL